MHIINGWSRKLKNDDQLHLEPVDPIELVIQNPPFEAKEVSQGTLF
jgi:hypothetical protein